MKGITWMKNTPDSRRLVWGLGMMIFLGLCLVGCGRHHPPLKRQTKTYDVQFASLHKTLHFTGTIQPLKESPLTSPMEAIVEAMPYHFGQFVQRDKEVFTLNSAELQKQYNETLTEYLKAKDSYAVAQAKFVGTEDLWKAGLLSKNNYVSEKSSMNTMRVALMQSTRKLSEMLEKMGDGTYSNLSQLSFDEFHKVRQALSGKHNMIHLKSPSDGVLLYAPKANEDKTGRITIGSAIKAGQVLALIGDMSGLRVEIDIPEIDIDKIKPGMPAVVHGVAFAKQELKGTLTFLNAQASMNTTGGLPSFTAIVEVKGLDALQQAAIKVGMSASIELAVDSIHKLLVPMAAIYQDKGKSMVTVIDKHGRTRAQQVVTGPAYENSVVIESGLTLGDVVTYDE